MSLAEKPEPGSRETMHAALGESSGRSFVLGMAAESLGYLVDGWLLRRARERNIHARGWSADAQDHEEMRERIAGLRRTLRESFTWLDLFFPLGETPGIVEVVEPDLYRFLRAAEDSEDPQTEALAFMGSELQRLGRHTTPEETRAAAHRAEALAGFLADAAIEHEGRAAAPSDAARTPEIEAMAIHLFRATFCPHTWDVSRWWKIGVDKREDWRDAATAAIRLGAKIAVAEADPQKEGAS